VRAAADELIIRGIIQRGLASRGRWLAFAVSAALALVAGARPLGWPALVVAVVPALALAVTGRLAAACTARLALELLA
jgi:membrane protease YdiL (CAAX protease family)